MDARLDTLSTKLYHVNIRVGRIARWQVAMGGFAPEPTPSLPHPVAPDSNAKDDDDDDDDDDDNDASDDDGDASSTDESSFWDMKVVTLRGRVSFWDHFVRGSVIFLRDVVRISCIFFFSFFIRYIVLVHELL